MNRCPVDYPYIRSVGYEIDDNTLEVEFEEGSIYQYFNAPEELYWKFRNIDEDYEFDTVPVKSSRFSEIGYDADMEILLVELHSGEVLLYLGIEEGVYDDFANSGSLGAFFNKNLKYAGYRRSMVGRVDKGASASRYETHHGVNYKNATAVKLESAIEEPLEKPVTQPRISRRPINYLHISSAGYDRENETMEVEFSGGAVYQYYHVPEEYYERFARGDSDGSDVFRERVDSPEIRSIGYDPELQTLHVGFHSKSVFLYFGVPEKIFKTLMVTTPHEVFLVQTAKWSGFRYHKINKTGVVFEGSDTTSPSVWVELSQETLGEMYLLGSGVEQDYQKAFSCFYNACSVDNSQNAPYQLGIMHSEGKGVEQDFQGAFMWFSIAAERGNPEAQYRLGSMYFSGEGVKQDKQKAVEWYTRASDLGSEDAKSALLRELRVSESTISGKLEVSSRFDIASDNAGTNDYFSLFDNPKDPHHFSAIRISISSPYKIRERSHGEVKIPETINYSTYKPERGGLLCERIFGPTRDYECSCGKYRRMKHQGIICEKCGVEVIPAKVRRERLGHIDLAAPVSNIWFLKSLPSRIGTLLNMRLHDLEKVIYYEAFVITDPRYTPLKFCDVMTEEKFTSMQEEYGSDAFLGGMGAEAIRECLKKIDLNELAVTLRNKLLESSSEFIRKKTTKRLKVVEAFRHSGNKPEWMILECIPVLPPELRPLVPLDGGRFATSDLNDLYRRVINRNNRLKRLCELQAPDEIIRNEKRMLQEAVDALFDNGRRGCAIAGPNNRPLKSLSDMIRGQSGRFRQNLLGKRVDYSGRSVIVVGPELELHQCGLPRVMALELYKPFIYSILEERGYVKSIKSAKKMVEKERPEVWDVLEEVIKEHPVILNRAPTLHRLGIQAFEPILIEGKAIQLHPLVCTAFNADFDGDQMAVHLPLSIESQVEARVLMMSTNSILSPANGKPIIVPSREMVFGIYYMTRDRFNAKGEYFRPTERELLSGKPVSGCFSSPEEVRIAFDAGEIDMQAMIKVRVKNLVTDDKPQIVATTTGRILLSEILPNKIPFSAVNKIMTKNKLSELLETCYILTGSEETIRLAEKLKDVGFQYATQAGISLCIDDMIIPEGKPAIIEKAHEEVTEIQNQYTEGLITDGERYNKVIDIWAKATEEIATEMLDNMSKEIVTARDGTKVETSSFNAIHMMVDSGARGSAQQIRQLAGMRALTAKPFGDIIETPITANLREGLTVFQYFISTYGTRVGLADTALKTANAGYLTRRLIDAAQNTIITEADCGTLDGMIVSLLTDSGEIIEHVTDRILGRVALEYIYDPITDAVLVEANQEIDENLVKRLEGVGLEKITMRSVITCQSKRGICAKCYGRDLSHGRSVNLGEAVGVIAAQSIGELGTRLTMHNFNGIGGLSRIVELFEAHKPLDCNIITEIDGRITYSKDAKGKRKVIVTPELGEPREYLIPKGKHICVHEGDSVCAGMPLMEGSTNPYDMLKLLGVKETAKLLVDEIKNIYRLHGANISIKHIEVIVRQMLRYIRIIDAGDTGMLIDDQVERWFFEQENEKAYIAEKRCAIAEPMLLGITRVSLSSESFLAAASFQEATKVLTQAAIEGKIDYLRGFKENVILGRQIPAGTGIARYRNMRLETNALADVHGSSNR